MSKKLNRKEAFVINAPVVTSAADTLKETLDYHKITQVEFAKRLGVSQKHVSELLNRKTFMSSETALKIQKITGLSAKLLLNLDLNYQLAHSQDILDNHNSKDDDYLKTFDWAIA